MLHISPTTEPLLAHGWCYKLFKFSKMDTIKAIQNLRDFQMAINTVCIEANQNQINKAYKDKLTIELNNLKSENKELLNYKRKLELIEKVSNKRICNNCDGIGGFVQGDEMSGFDEFECSSCQGTGINSL